MFKGRINKHEKNLDIELMRFIMTLCVAVLHFSEDYGFVGIFNGGYLGVDFFFVIGGFYLANHYVREKDNSSFLPMKKATNFVKHRVKKIYYPYIFSLIIMIIFLLKDNNWSLLWLKNYLYDVKWQFIFLHYLGAGVPFTMRSIWYLSVYIFLLYTVYFFLAYNEDFFVGVSPILSVLSLIYIYVNYGTLSMQGTYNIWISGGVLRGFAEMCLGVYIFYTIDEKNLESTFHNKSGNVIYWAKYILAIYIIYLMQKYGFDSNDFWILFLIIVYIRLSYVRHDEFIKSKYIKNVITWLGNISLWIYLLHLVVSKVLCDVCAGIDYKIMLIIYLVLIVIVSSVAFLIEKGIYYYKDNCKMNF